MLSGAILAPALWFRIGCFPVLPYQLDRARSGFGDRHIGAANMYSGISSGILKLAFSAMLIFAGVTSSFAQQNKQDDDLSAPEAIALGILALGAGIVASEIDKEFFTEAPAPTAQSNGQRIPSDPNNARDINAGEEWNPRQET